MKSQVHQPTVDNTTTPPSGSSSFHNMQELPPVAHDLKGNKEKFSITVLLYDVSDLKWCQLGYYDFEFEEWSVFGEESMELICWCYPPLPIEFVKNNKLQTVKHKGYRD